MDGNRNRINDYLFKWIFGREENKDILLSLLNSILVPAGQGELSDISLIGRELDQEHNMGKLSRLDILGKGSDGSVINIEVQIINEKDIDKRTLYYWAKLYFMELRKWRALPVPAKNLLDKWFTYLSNRSPLEVEAIAMSEPAIRKALTLEEIFFKQDEERHCYELREKGLLDYASDIGNAREEGREERNREIALPRGGSRTVHQGLSRRCYWCCKALFPKINTSQGTLV